MSFDKPVISIVIPSHNRSKSLKRLLDKLSRQNFHLPSMEVIVVADGCKDDTVSILKQYKALFSLQYIELPGEGPAIARNKGAGLATGKILLFLDDDIDPSENLVAAHVAAHENEHIVVIGYLPFAGKKNDFFSLDLRLWWEQKFQQMSKPGYRYSYEDLLSGNVSLSLDLFRKVQGFDIELRCREDYELGIRLIKSGAEFIFSKEAWGYHCDEITDMNRSLKRKRQEGKADVQFWHLHPDMTTSLQDAYLKDQYTFLRSKAVFFVINFPWLTDIIAWAIEKLMKPLETLRLRDLWNRFNYKLHIYWYLRGLLDELHTRKNLNEYLRYKPGNKTNKEVLEIDLEKGFTAAEQLLDQVNPYSVRLTFGEQVIGVIPYKPGMEKLKGAHLRYILANELSSDFLKTIALQSLMKNVEGSSTSSIL